MFQVFVGSLKQFSMDQDLEEVCEARVGRGPEPEKNNSKVSKKYHFTTVLTETGSWIHQ